MQANEFVAPFFYRSDDLMSFDSIEGMRQYVEPCDVEEDDRGFDSLGRRIVLRGVGVVRTRFSVGGGNTVFDAEASGEVAVDDFVEMLIEYVRRVGADRVGFAIVELTSVPLADLVAAVATFTATR